MASKLKAIFFLALIWAGIYLPRLGDPELRGEEPRRVLPGLTMLETGNWLVPYVGGEPYLRKPPMINWLVALSFGMTGRHDEFAARLPSVLAVLILALGVYSGSFRWLGGDYAFVAAIALLTTISMVDKGRLIEIEALYVTGFGLALLSWIRFKQSNIWLRWPVPSVFLGFDLLVKGPLHLIFYYGIVGCVIWREKRLKELFSVAHLFSLLLMAAIVAAWAIPHLQTAEAHDATRVWSDQFSGRLALSEFHWKDWLLNYLRALSNFLPWILIALLPSSTRKTASNQKSPSLPVSPDHSGLVSGIELGTLATFLIVMMAPGALPRYSMPLVVPVALLAASRLKGRMPDGIGKLTPVRLALSCGVIFILAVLLYCLTLMPAQMKREVLRPRAAALATLVPLDEPIYAINPGPQQIFFYLRKPWQYVGDLNALPAQAHYLLVSEKDLHQLTQRFGIDLRPLFSYQDRGEKASYLVRLP